MPPIPPSGYYAYRSQFGTSFARNWPARTSIIPGAVQLHPSMLNEIEDYIRDLGHVQKNFQYGMNALVQILARAQVAFAQRKSRGPVDPRQTNPNAAWKIPVRRITSHYYQGWQVRRIRPGVWMVYNLTREAYYIEFGIHVSTRRVRRPINKMSLLNTLHWADHSRAGPKVWEEVFGSMRGRGFRGRGSGILYIMPQSPGVMGRL
jgi:hypothetical protein